MIDFARGLSPMTEIMVIYDICSNYLNIEMRIQLAFLNK